MGVSRNRIHPHMAIKQWEQKNLQVAQDFGVPYFNQT